MSLTPATYTQSACSTNAETGWGDTPTTSKTGGPQFQDCTISAATVGDGTLRQRFDLVAYPYLGHKATGTDSDGNPVPATAKTVTGT